MESSQNLHSVKYTNTNKRFPPKNVFLFPDYKSVYGPKEMKLKEAINRFITLLSFPKSALNILTVNL